MRGRPITYWPYSLFTAEVASNFHQALMGHYLLDHYTDREWVLAILEERMSNHLRYFFIMPILAQFEYWTHTEIEQGGALTANSMTDKLADLFIEAYGDTVVVSEEDRPRVGITWAQFAHMHMDYYVYQYATGISAAAALAKHVLDGGEPVVQRYRNFLSRSGDGYPIDLLKEAGVDMTSPAPVEDAFAILAGYVDRLEQLANEQP
jgi:oligoendopeptidase F